MGLTPDELDAFFTEEDQMGLPPQVRAHFPKPNQESKTRNGEMRAAVGGEYGCLGANV